jgi:sigma-B regulation protein RsbU (phosphoserine phosphatase)
VLDRAICNKHAGEMLNVLVRRPNGTQFSTAIRLAPIRNTPASLSSWIITLAIQFLLPICCLALGFWVAAVRPYDSLAWVLLALMIGLSQFVQSFSWIWPLMPVAIVWNAVLGFPYGICLCWLFLFALLFPERPAFDRRRSWLKWVLLIPLILQSVSFVVFVLASDYEFAALAPLRPLLDQFPLHTYLTFVAISAFFALLGMKSATGGTAEVRRRLRILYFGTAFSSTPMLIRGNHRHGQRTQHTERHSAVGYHHGTSGAPAVSIDMAYVIVVQRAMEVRVVLGI